ncbi:MAG TPA: YncE family protein [Gemmatimonadales bacterium]|nr:YncE family protein [Gemmatimonadales bacterium]
MPPLRLTSLLQTALPELSSASRAVVNTLACLNGNALSARDMAEWVGLRDRYQLARALRRDGLPPLEQLAGWSRVLYWISESESSGASLRQLAQRDHVDPAVAYRLVHRVMGLPWSEAQRAGLSVAVLRLRERRGVRVMPGRKQAVALPARMARAVGDDVVTSIAGTPARAPRPPALLAAAPQHPAAVLGDRLVTGGGPFDVAMVPKGLALITRPHSAAVDVVRVHPLSVVATIRTGPVPTRVVVDPLGTRAYVTNQFAEEVGIIDLHTLRQAGAIPIQGHPLGAAIAPDGHTLYVATNLDRLHAVALPQGRILASVPIPMGALHLVVHPSGRRVYVPCFKAGVIVELDAHTLCPMRQFAVGGMAQDVVMTRDGTTLYVANEGGWLNAVHLPTGRVSSLTLDGPSMGLALSPDQEVLFVGLLFAGRIAVVDTRTFKVSGAIVTGGRPRLIAFERTGRTALVANEAGTVDQIR